MTHQSLYIPFKTSQRVGGPYTFMDNLRTYLHEHGVELADSYKEAGVLFFADAVPLKMLTRVKNRGGWILQRLDGVYYPSQHGDAYLSLNRDITHVYHRYADVVIFQSEYSQKQCFAMLGAKPEKQYRIIRNGVDKKRFYPANEARKSHSGPIRFVSTGSYRKAAMIEPLALALDDLQKTFDFELWLVGPIINPAIEHFFKRSYIRHWGSRSADEVAEILRKSDVFLHSQLNDNCPNAVLEAISCGLPVVGFDSGAMSELCFFSKELLAYVSDEVIQKYEDFDYRLLRQKILQVVQNYEQYQANALAHSHLYSFDECGRQYLEVFTRYLHASRKRIPAMIHQCKTYFKKVRRLPGRLKSFLVKRLVSKPDSFFQRLVLRLPPQQCAAVLSSVLRQKSSVLPPDEALKFLFDVENRLYSLEGVESVRYGHGLHTKHKHIQYHDFFIHRIEPDSRVLDIGCGNGALAHDIATQGQNVSVYGIDLAQKNIDIARRTHAAENITYLYGNALTDLPDQTVDVIVLSNVLEHIEQRVDFLKELQKVYHPRKFLIRVPVFERDWRVPLKEELGVDYRLDPTHYIEYRQGEFATEIAQAGLHIRYMQINWGEIWAEIGE